jgi:hypothetical protein
VKAEPVQAFPHAIYARHILEPAARLLTETMVRTTFLDTGLIPGWLIYKYNPFGKSKSKGGEEQGPSERVNVHYHAEKLGVVVEVVTTKSSNTLDRYLAGKGLAVRAANVSSLQYYLNEDYTLVCCWAASGPRPVTARALQIDFPTPKVFYPLRPTQVYETDITTSLYIRGWVQPDESVTLPGLRCDYVHGIVSEIDRELEDPDEVDHEHLTRVELPASPQRWTQDLLLEEGTPNVIEVADFVDTLDEDVEWLIPLLLGVIAASFLPWTVIPGQQRRWFDHLWAAAVGAAICLSIFGSVAVFYLWQCTKPQNRPEPSLVRKIVCFVIFGGVHLAMTWILCASFVVWFSLY